MRKEPWLCDGGGGIKFFKGNAGFISNVAVALIVLVAIFVKIRDEGAAVMFRAEDAYVIVGAFLALLVLRIAAQHQRKK